jgi:hypothetical protein
MIEGQANQEGQIREVWRGRIVIGEALGYTLEHELLGLSALGGQLGKDGDQRMGTTTHRSVELLGED